jgi:putative DNA primase/helicase
VVYQGQGLAEHDYQEAGTLEGWKREVAAPAIGNSRLAIALCAGLVGPLLAWAGAEGGGLHLRGPSSIGKSTALEAAASIWGPKSFVRQWRATANGLEGAAELANETLLVLDELAQLAPGEAGSVAYMLANGCGKSRAAQNGDARAAKRWQTFFCHQGK